MGNLPACQFPMDSIRPPDPGFGVENAPEEPILGEAGRQTMNATALVVTQDTQVQSVVSSILAELRIEVEMFTEVSLAEVALRRARFAAVVVDCDLGGADRLLKDSSATRAAISFAVSTPGKSKGSPKANFGLSKPLQMPLVRLTMRGASDSIWFLYRRSFRCELATPIFGSGLGKAFRAQTINISMGGIAIQTRQALTRDEPFRIEFALPNGLEIKSDATVVWTDKLGRVGLLFIGMQNSARHGLQDWLDTKNQNSQGGDNRKGLPSKSTILIPA